MAWNHGSRTTAGSQRRWTRRSALKVGAGAAGLAALGGGFGRAAAQEGAPIEIPAPVTDLPADEVTFRWIDSGDQKAIYWRAFFDRYQQRHPNITVQYDGMPWTEIQEVVPLGLRNGNAHDVFELPPNLPRSQAVAEGWVAPLNDIIPGFEAWKATFPPGAFVPGITDFDGLTYTFPLFSNERYSTILLYNTDYMTRAGYDPATAPLTWDEFRAAARTITEQGAGDYYGFIIGGSQTGRWMEVVRNFGRMAGASAGDNDIDWRTGEYVYTSDEYLAAVELLLALRDDGSVFPGSLSLNAPQARAQFPQGVAGMILQGPWNISIWQQEHPDFAFDVASQPVPNAGEPLPLTVGPAADSTNYWVYAGSPHKAVAGDILSFIGSPEGIGAYPEIVGEDVHVIFPEANARLDPDPVAGRALAHFEESVRLGPDPRVRNAEAASVYLEFRPLTPNFGEIVQGIYSGQLDDPRAALRDLQDRSEAELERAIGAAREAGADVTRDDWVFPNWDPARDYTADDYAAL